ncbi:MAG TPA: serine/threonine-protein kinase [Polyangiaceae bacterium]
MYQVVGVVTIGAASVIYDVKDTVLNVRRVLKMLEPGCSASHDRRMLREREMLAGFDHPNIVRVVFAGRTTDDRQLPYYVMEKLEGLDLRRWLRGGRFPVERALSIAADILKGLGAAHARGILHRDVKPDNIFLQRAPESPWYETKLLDFGCAKWNHQPSSDQLLGTINYVAPELMDGAEASEKSDVYATGVTLYEMLTAHHPYGRLPISTRRGPPPPLSKYIEANDDLIELVCDALSPLPDARIPSARVFAFRLAQVRYRVANCPLVEGTTDIDTLVAEKMPSTQRMPSAPRFDVVAEDDEQSDDEGEEEERSPLSS